MKLKLEGYQLVNARNKLQNKKKESNDKLCLCYRVQYIWYRKQRISALEIFQDYI